MRCFALQVGGELLQPPLRLSARRHDPAQLLLQSLARHREPLRRRSRRGLRQAQRRQPRLGLTTGALLRRGGFSRGRERALAGA